MTVTWYRCLVIFCLAGTFFFASPMETLALSQNQAGDGHQSVRRALMIGIKTYKNHRLNSLPGTANDIELVHQVLTSRFGFSPDHIRVLKDKAATHDAILSALRQLVKDTATHDVVYVHYSGHGSQVKDLNGDERTQDNDELDETLVPYDGRTPGVPDIIDDELGEILSRLKTKHAVIVIDACHSGSITRGVAVGTRWVAPDSRLALYQRGGARTRGEVILFGKPYVLLTGAKANQSALDVPIKERAYGAFTYSLFQSLGAMPLTASAREVLKGAEAELKKLQDLLNRTQMPEPQLEGSKERLMQPMFPPLEENTRLQWSDVQVLSPERILLVRGALLGALPGSRWALYTPGETTFLPGKEIASAVVLENQDSDAVARIEASRTSVPQGARAVMIASALSKNALVMRLRDAPQDVRTKLEAALRKQGIRVVGPNDFAPFVVDATNKDLRISSADGLEQIASLPLTSTTQAADDLTTLLQRSSTVSQLLALDNPSSGLSLDVRVVQGGQATRGVGVFADLETPTYHIRQKGEPRNHTNSLQLEIQVDQDTYLTIVDVDTEGGVSLLFPNKHSDKRGFYAEGRVGAGESVRVPDDLRSGNRARFHWDYVPPPGQDTIRVFASTDLETAETIRQHVQNLMRGSQAITRGGSQASRALSVGFAGLSRALARPRERGIITVPAEPEDASLFSDPQVQKFSVAPDWTARSVTVIIEP